MIYRFFNWIKAKLGFGANNPKVPTPEPAIEVEAPRTPVDGASTSVEKVILGNVQGTIAGEKEMIVDAVALVDKVISSDEFKQAVLNIRFTSTDGLSNLEIYNKITGEQTVVNITMFYGSYMQNFVWKTQGYEQGDGVVYANRYFINKAFDLASLILHEVTHQKGFHHVSSSEYTSVPYRMNEIFETVSEQLGIKRG